MIDGLEVDVLKKAAGVCTKDMVRFTEEQKETDERNVSVPESAEERQLKQ